MANDIAYSGRIEGKSHLLPVRVYYEDTDMSGIVYHANYLRYFERGRTDFLRCAGIIHTELANGENPIAFAVVSMNIKYKKAARIDNSLLVHTQYIATKGAKLLINQKITRGEEIITTAEVEAIIIDFNGSPQRPPKEMLEKLNKFFN